MMFVLAPRTTGLDRFYKTHERIACGMVFLRMRSTLFSSCSNVTEEHAP